MCAAGLSIYLGVIMVTETNASQDKPQERYKEKSQQKMAGKSLLKWF